MNTRYIKLMFLTLLLGAVSFGIVHVAKTDAQTYTTTSTTTTGAFLPSSCLNFPYDMGMGQTNGNVVALQTFLNGQGYMSYPSTGYYGSLTYAAVVRFQAAHGISTTGYVGPITRAAISKYSCANTANGVTVTNISPSVAQVGETVTLTGFGFTSNNVIHFAGGAIGGIPSTGGIAVSCTTDPACVPGIRQTLSFTVPSYIGPYCAPATMCPMYVSRIMVPGTYQLYVTNDNGTSNNVTLSVTDGTTANKVSISSISPVSGPVGTTVTITGTGFTNDNTVYIAGGAIQHIPANTIYTYNGIVCNGYPNCTAPQQSLTFTVPEAIGQYCAPGMYCIMLARVITPGTYDVVVGNDTYGKSNATRFTVTGGTNNGSPLTITGIDAPNQLSMGTTGTWTVRMNASQPGTLRYSVLWGDEAYATTSSMIMPPTTSPVSGSASFSHAYQRAGTYTPTFTVSDDYGRTVTTSATITVTPWY